MAGVGADAVVGVMFMLSLRVGSTVVRVLLTDVPRAVAVSLVDGPTVVEVCLTDVLRAVRALLMDVVRVVESMLSDALTVGAVAEA